MNRSLRTPLRVLVVDDEPLARNAAIQLLRRDPEVCVCGSCANVGQALGVVRERDPELILLDVRMPEQDGFALLETLEATRGDRPLPVVIFITAHDRFAVRAFEVHALDYLLKPYRDSRFFEAIERAKRRAFARRPDGDPASRPPRHPDEPDPLVIRAGGNVHLVDHTDVRWFEAADHYVLVHTTTGSHAMRESIGELEKRLDAAHFLRVHRSSIVNVRHVRELRRSAGGHEAVLGDGTRVTISRRRRRYLERFLGEGAVPKTLR